MHRLNFISLLTALFLVSSGLAAEVGNSNSNTPKVAPASDEGEQAIKRFQVPKGFKVELFAAEPHLANPVCFAIDEQGRFYVAETFRHSDGVLDIRGIMSWLEEELASTSVEERVRVMKRHLKPAEIEKYSKQSERVKLIWDADGDGRADHSTVFAEGFNQLESGIAAGVLARHGDVYLANIPSLWLLRDTTGDGQADVRKELHTGFGVRVGFLGHDLHGLRFGPDGKLYFSIGDRGARVKTAEGRIVENPETGAVYRCNPDGSDLEIFASGLRNPQELVFDQYGNLWTGDNNSDGGDPARWVYVVERGDSGWRVGYQFMNNPSRGPWIAERFCYPAFPGQAAHIVPPIATLGNGPSGLTYNPGVGLPETYREHFFLADFRGGAGSGVHSFAVNPKGAGFELTNRSDFIWQILATDVDFGYDGALYVSDWVNGWGKTGKGRLYRVFDPTTRNQPVVRETAALMKQGFKQRTSIELGGLLTHPDMRVRQEAQFELAARGNKGLPTLKGIAARNNPLLARLHAVWGLGQIGRTLSGAYDAVIPLLDDADPEVRAQAAKVLGDGRVKKAERNLIKLLQDPAPRPRFFAAISLGKIGSTNAVGPLFAMLEENDNKDPYLRHAGIVGLSGGAKLETLAAAARNPIPAVRLASVIALRRLRQDSVVNFLDDENLAIRRDAARAISDTTITSAFPALAARVSKFTEDEPSLLRALNVNFRLGAPTHAQAVAQVATEEKASTRARLEALSMLGDWEKPSNLDRFTGLYRPLAPRESAPAAAALETVLPALLKTSPVEVKTAALQAAGKLKARGAAGQAFALVNNPSEAAAVRVQALKLLAELDDPRLAQAVAIGAAAPEEGVRKEATRQLSQLKPATATLQLSKVLGSGSVNERQAALAALGSIPGAEAARLLNEQLQLLATKKLAPELHLDLIEAAARRSEPEIKVALKQSDQRSTNDPLAEYREVLQGGDAAEGRKIFIERQEASCVRCHRVNGEGGEVGPELAGLGSKKTREYLLDSIVRPNKDIAAGYETVLVTMKNGTSYAGTVKSETPSVLEVNSPEDGLLKLKKTEITERQRGLSAMPEELKQVLTKRDLRNLVEFLSSLK